MAIQHRRGLDAQFDPTKILSGELAVTTDGEKLYYGTIDGVVKTVLTTDSGYPASDLVTDADHRTVTDAQIAFWNTGTGTGGVSTGDMLQSVYDTNTNGKVDKAESIDDGTYTATAQSISEAVTNKHIHDNKTILDGTTASYTSAEKTKIGKINYSGALSSIDLNFMSYGVNAYATGNVGTGALNNVTKAGFYYSTDVESHPTGYTGINGFVMHTTSPYSSGNTMVQTFIPTSADVFFIRRKVSGTWQTWVNVSGSGIQTKYKQEYQTISAISSTISISTITYNSLTDSLTLHINGEKFIKEKDFTTTNTTITLIGFSVQIGDVVEIEVLTNAL